MTTAEDELPPLIEIERRVQERAKDLALDPATPAGESGLLALIDDELAGFADDFQRGRRAYELADPELIAERAFRNLAGYGPLAPLLADDDVWEIMINAPDAVFVKRHSGTNGYHHEVFHDDDHVLRTLTKILDDSSGSHRKLDPTLGLQDAQLDDGARLHIVHRDVSRGGHVMVNIRKFTGVAFKRLPELVERHMLTADVARFLTACVRSGQSIVFSGAPGSGKTTLLSCCAAELDPSLRVVVAEEVFEADVPLANVASMQTRPTRADRPEVDLRRLVAGFLRMAPDVAIVGEVRDREALPLLLTLSSGVKGYTTIHAGSARQALTRLRFVCQLSDSSNDLPMAALNSLVSEAVDVVVHCVRGPSGPRVREIVAVEELAGGPEATQFTVTDLFTTPTYDDDLRWTGNVPVRLGAALEAQGYEPVALLRGGGAFRVGVVVSGLLAAIAAASGTFLLYTRWAFGWRTVLRADSRRSALHRWSRHPQQWLTQVGLDRVRTSEFLAVVMLLFVIGSAGGFALFGAPLPALLMGGFVAAFPVATLRRQRRVRLARAEESWPRMIEEIRILTGSSGRSIPQALFEVGARAPVELRPAFEAAQREWLLSTDFPRTISLLKARLVDPTADAACETLLVADELGGSDLDRRLEDLAEDRRQDIQGRKDARAKQAGARFARKFVLIVPLGMAFAGMSVGNGRQAYQTPTGQLAVILALGLVMVCWLWAGLVMRLPAQERVFTE